MRSRATFIDIDMIRGIGGRHEPLLCAVVAAPSQLCRRPTPSRLPGSTRAPLAPCNKIAGTRLRAQDGPGPSKQYNKDKKDGRREDAEGEQGRAADDVERGATVGRDECHAREQHLHGVVP